MCEPSEEDNNNNTTKPSNLLMDLDDLDLDSSWPPLDQITMSSNPMIMSPLVVSSSEQPCSPLWAYSDPAADDDEDEDDEKISSASAVAPTFRLSEYPLFLTYAGTPNAVAEGTAENDSNQFSSALKELIPLDNNESYWIIKQRMTQALRNFKESTEQHVLAQVWAPIKKGGRYVLTTSGQPFVLDPHSNGLNQYRTVSLMYMFSVDGESDVDLGLPGRVFRHKLPEWTPNVQYYSSKEFSRLDHALHYNVRGTLALPVFGSSGQSCVGVVELIMTSEKINYAPEVDKVCKALQAVNLKSSDILDHKNTQICNVSRQNALAEILKILTVVCETHKLPLAQTWVPCMHRSVLAYNGGLKKSCTSFDGSCMGQVCMSTTDAACYVVDAHVWGFRDACLEHHLQKSQGVAGRAFLNRSSCFCRDVTKFCKTEYPLVHYARMFKLTSCFAICLQSSHTGDDDYILEFFLPTTIADKSEQDSLLGCLLATMKQNFQSLRVASGIEIGENQVSVEIIEASDEKKIDHRTVSIKIPFFEKLPDTAEIPLNSLRQQPNLKSDLVNSKGVFTGNNVRECHASAATTKAKEMKKPEKKRGKAEKTISLDVLQQYFSGSLKDAAKSLGVCPTTMKRICRQHGISRWPSRKINKVNRSLTKLKRVIESVQGTDGALDLTNLSSSPLPVTVGSISWTPNSNGALQASSPNASKPPEQLQVLRNGSPNCFSPPTDLPTGVNEYYLLPGRLSTQEHNVNEQNYFAELSNPSKRSKTGSGSREESAGTPTSHASCEGSPVNETKQPIREHCFTIGGSPESPFEPEKEPNFSSAFSVPTHPLLTGLQDHFGGMFVKDAGSSKDLRKLCPSENFPESGWVNPVPVSVEAVGPSQPRPGMTSVTIKATYGEDIIRFRISLNSGINELKDEVAKRLKLELGTFDIKYLDDDHEWVLIACDADLQECLDVSRSSGANIVRLSVNDVTANPGSSCESTGDL